MTSQPVYMAGDIVLVRGYNLVSRLIRWFTRSVGEGRTVVNHVGVMVDGENIVESLDKTVIRKLSDGYTDSVYYVVRRIDLTDGQRYTISSKARSYIGRSYGWAKIVAHGLDRLLGNIYLFRRLASMDKYPICSWIVAYSYRQVSMNFGVPPYIADPDDIYDYCMEKESKQFFKVIYNSTENDYYITKHKIGEGRLRSKEEGGKRE